MKNVSKYACASLLAVVVAAPAFSAPTTPTPGSSDQPQNAAANEAGLRDRLQGDLTKAGFTDIRIMPESFLVRAKDSRGDTIMMVINPDSVTEVVGWPPKANGGASPGGTQQPPTTK